MRYSAIVSLVFLGCMSLVSQAVQPPMGMSSPYVPSPYATPVMSGSAGCACGQPAYAPAPVNACGGCGSYSGLCNNPAAFYEQLYSEFYARNQWYVIAKEQENAERRARLSGLPQPTQQPQPVHPSVKPNRTPVKSTLDNDASDSSILDKTDTEKSAAEKSASDK